MATTAEKDAIVENMLKTFGVMSSALLSSGDNIETGLESLVSQAASQCPDVNGKSSPLETSMNNQIVAMKHCMEQGGVVKPGTAAHWAWKMAMKDEEFAHAYLACGKEHSKTREFKVKWASKQIAVCTEQLEEFHSSTSTDSAAGSYRTISQILDKQGRDAAGALAARNMIVELLGKASRGQPS